jgi:hypothetical protein
MFLIYVCTYLFKKMTSRMARGHGNDSRESQGLTLEACASHKHSRMTPTTFQTS